MSLPTYRQLPLSMKLFAYGFVAIWCLIAAFPILWVAVISFKLPIDSFDHNPLVVLLGPNTVAAGKGISVFDLVMFIGLVWALFRVLKSKFMIWGRHSGFAAFPLLGWASVSLGFMLLIVVTLFMVLPGISAFVNPNLGFLGQGIIGFTLEHYEAIWVEREFYRNFINSMVVTFGVVTISLTIGTLAGYGLARSGTKLAFWLLVVALVFRALPHSVLVAGYMPVFINSAEILAPIFGDAAPTFYGQPLAVIAVLVAINQPFTIWMLRSFFQNIPVELDESARVDGCNHIQAFRHVIMPVMWPGVITTGLFSFLLAYNDFLVTSLLLDMQNQTMVPAIANFFNMETTSTDQVQAVAAAVSIIAPLFVLVMVFQRQIVSGLTAGAVKG